MYVLLLPTGSQLEVHAAWVMHGPSQSFNLEIKERQG